MWFANSWNGTHLHILSWLWVQSYHKLYDNWNESSVEKKLLLVTNLHVPRVATLLYNFICASAQYIKLLL